MRRLLALSHTGVGFRSLTEVLYLPYIFMGGGTLVNRRPFYDCGSMSLRTLRVFQSVDSINFTVPFNSKDYHWWVSLYRVV